MLPKLDVPVYEIKTIIGKKKIKFRPFLVKEQKLFLMASESDDPDEILSITKQVLKNCILSEDVDVDKLPTFELENLFLNLRARSVQEVVELKYKCNNNIKDTEGNEKKCGNIVSTELNLLEVKPNLDPKHTNKLAFTPEMGVVLKYPDFSMLEKISKIEEQDEISIEVLIGSIDYIYDKDSVYYAKDHTRQELEDFIESLQQKHLEQIKQFFETIPKIEHTLHFKCSKCGYNEDIHLKGLQDFFV